MTPDYQWYDNCYEDVCESKFKKNITIKFIKMVQNIIESCQVNEYPLISVIVPAYNAQEYIGATLQSLVHQSYPNLEIIVVDDGSTDKTARIVKNTIKKDNRIKLFQQINCGVAAARNLAIRHSRGDFIAPVDADDICYPKKFEKLIDCFQNFDPRLGLVYSWSTIIDKYGNLIGTSQKAEFEGDVFEYLLFHNFIGNASSCLIRKKCFDVIGVYNPSFFMQKAQGCEDYDIYLRIAEHFQLQVIKDFLTGYRKTESAMSRNYKCMEKSRQLVFQDVQLRKPWIPDVVFKWALAYYYLWLSSVAAKNGSFHDTLRYLIKAAHNDPVLIKNSEYLRLIYRYMGSVFKKKLKSTFLQKNKNICLKKTHHLHAPYTNFSITDLKQKAFFQAKQSSLFLLKEKRRMMSYHLIKHKPEHSPIPDEILR